MSILSQQCVALLDRTGRIETRVSNIEDQMATMQQSMSKILSAQETHKSEIIDRLDSMSSHRGASTPPPPPYVINDTPCPVKFEIERPVEFEIERGIRSDISTSRPLDSHRPTVECYKGDWNFRTHTRAVLRGLLPYWFVRREDNGTCDKARVYIHPDLKVREVKLALQDQLNFPLFGLLMHKGTLLNEDRVWSSYNIPSNDDISFVSWMRATNDIFSRLGVRID
ncbi:hypothetical protein QBC47DRAFT_54353 [Echria macrotheca]|uniref:Ubiquitin-like domain-containing protein n=1 Tax=Echria macrotheca TaxID=438768 RepID=A0AAJ0B7R1_9PEZI|nr:hypothetical protein QBC47DRAFT_54353 [Echria macrotheca]